MKLATFTRDSKQSFGAVTDGGVCDIPKAWPDGPKSMLELLQGGTGAMARAAELAEAETNPIAEDQVKLLAPVPNPPKIIGLAVNYAEHHREWERGADLPDDPRRHTTPRPFLMPHSTIIGPGDEIPWPPFSEQIDYEVELAVIIGRAGKCLSPEQARDHIAGYTIANDISARSTTFARGRTARPKDDFFDWLHGKWADGFCPTGPYLVTADQIGDPMDLAIGLSVNGEQRQSSRTSAMIFDVFELVSFISCIMTLSPGDIIATGTPSGVAKATGKWLDAGDEITCRIDNIGELTNTLGPRPDSFYKPCE